jgi:hypothetical protein
MVLIIFFKVIEIALQLTDKSIRLQESGLFSANLSVGR